jgi:CDP-diglyceride synthetase
VKGVCLLIGATQMNDALLSELLIMVFAGLVAIAIMRKNTPRPVEILLWVGLISVCLLGVTGIHDKQARDLTGATFWGATQMVGSLVTVGLLGVRQWLVDNRFLLADLAVLVAGADLLILAFLRRRRHAAGWQPQVRLRDWMELPRLTEPKPAPVTVSAVDDLNRRFNLWAPVATAAALTWTTLFLIWTGDVAAPTVGRRIRKVAVSADGARRRVVTADWRRVVEKAGSEPRRLTEQVVDIADLSRRATEMRSRAATWLGEAGATVNAPDGGKDSDGTERDRRDQLAS